MSDPSPDAMARACAPDPLYESLNLTDRPVFFFHSAANAGRIPSRITSRTTEYAPIESSSVFGSRPGRTQRR